MKSKKHILILTPGFPESNSDSTCIPSLQALVRELHLRYGSELRISVVCFQYPFEKGYFSWNGIECWSAGGSNRRLPVKLLTWLRVAGFIMRLHKKHPVHVIHSFWLHDCTLIGQWMAKLFGAKHLAHAMGQDVLANNPYLKYLNLKKLLVIANSPYSSDILIREHGVQSHKVISFGIFPGDFIRIQETSRKIDLLAVGSLISIKNHVLFIELFATLKKSFPGLTGSIIGSGPLKDELVSHIKHHGLQGCLFLEGQICRSDVLKRMSESKILLHTAPFESAAYVFLEALYSGMRVVSFQTGFLPAGPGSFPSKDKTEMLEILNTLLNEKQVYQRVKVPLISETAAAVFELYRD